MTTSPRLLAIAPSCLTAVNRAVYRLLASRHGLAVHLVVPARAAVGGREVPCAPTDGEPIPVTPLMLRGSHSRLQTLDGLAALLDDFRPTHVLVEGDPATRLTLQVLRHTRVKPPPRTRVWVLTCENFERRHLGEAWQRLRRGRFPAAAGSLVTALMLRRARRGVDHVFTISNDGDRALAAMGFAGRVTRVPLGFDPDLFFPHDPDQVHASRQRLGLDRPTVAYFGRLAPEKGVDVLLRALARLGDLPWQLLLDQFSAYQGPYTVYLGDLVARLGLAGRVRCFDATHAQMPDFMNAANVVVLPSIEGPGIKEQYGRVLPEAMACGKVVIGSRVGAIPELVGDAGVLVPPGDPEALAVALRRLLTAPAEELAPLRARALRRARDHLSITTQARAWADHCYQDAATDGRANAGDDGREGREHP